MGMMITVLLLGNLSAKLLFDALFSSKTDQDFLIFQTEVTLLELCCGMGPTSLNF